MSYVKEVLEKDQVKLTFDVAEADWKAALDESFNKNKNKFSVEGFRKGHVPRKVVESWSSNTIFFPLYSAITSGLRQFKYGILLLILFSISTL